MRTGARGKWTSAEMSHQEHSRVAKRKAVDTESQDRCCGCYSKVHSYNHQSVFDNMYLGKVKPCRAVGLAFVNESDPSWCT